MPSRFLPRLRRATAVGLPLILLPASAAVFAGPWGADPQPGGALLARYAPQPDGASWLYERRGPSGDVDGWRSANMSAAPARLAVSVLAPPLRESVTRRYESSGRALDAVTVVEVREQDLDREGTRPVPVVNHYLRDDEGISYLAVRDANGDAVFEPPLLLLPADLREGRAWTSEGALGRGGLTYEYSGEVGGPAEERAGPAEGRDCLQVESRLVLRSGDLTVQDESYDELWCDGLGQAASDATGPSGAPVRSLEVMSFSASSTGAAATAIPVEPRPDGSTDPGLAENDDPSTWRLDTYARLDSATGLTVAPNAPPAWFGGDEPIVVTAASDGTLTAIDAGDAPGDVRWRLHTAGIGYGPPTVDPDRGRLYFGTSDKHLYAVDARGLFLWAVPTHDNIASRPAVGGDLVVFGSEDRHVYAVDASSGQLRWSRRLPGPVVSSPVFVDGLFVIGCDDGSVHGLSPDGRRRWRYRVGAPVESALAAAGDAVLVGDSEGGLTSLDAGSGRRLWAVGTGSRGSSTPVVASDLAVVVDGGGRMHAYDIGNGDERWRAGRDLVGPAAVLGRAVVAADRHGLLVAFDAQGRPAGEWDATGTPEGTTHPPGVSTGLVSGGGAVWAVDDGGVLRRLGPSSSGVRPLTAGPRRLAAEVSPTGGALVSTVARYRGLAVVLDGTGAVTLLDPRSGVAAAIARVEGPVTGEPVVAGTTLLVPGANDLHALALPDGDELWTQSVGSTGWRPVVVADDLVVAVASQGRSAEVVGIEIDGGRVRWRRPTSVEGLAAGGVALGDLVFAGSPVSAIDIADGEARWTAAGDAGVAAGLALDPERGAVYAATRRSDGQGVTVRALDTGDGTPRWETSLEGPDAVAYDSLALAGDTVVAPTAGRAVHGLDATTGEVRWRFDAPAPRLGSVAVLDGLVWVPLVDGRVVVLDGSDGRVVAFAPGTRGREPTEWVAQRPAEVDGVVLLPTGDALAAYEAPR